MAQINDGLTFGLDQFKFNNQVLGYISEEGLAWGGDKPEKVKINATQVKSGPVKIIVKNNGTNVFVSVKVVYLRNFLVISMVVKFWLSNVNWRYWLLLMVELDILSARLQVLLQVLD